LFSGASYRKVLVEVSESIMLGKVRRWLTSQDKVRREIDAIFASIDATTAATRALRDAHMRNFPYLQAECLT
jgi:hypothetical protein